MVLLYFCSPRRDSRKLWTVHETVSCMQQFYTHVMHCVLVIMHAPCYFTSAKH